ncbi:MAG: twin-arginine translocase TatA/TatE family subunit [Novosphingobium sp.]|nr:twin-arginine translocase TatA/TatE family subunit [Novosphingobium sp.]
MGGLSIWHWLIVLLVVLVLFGRGRVSEIMGDFGKGIKSFKQGMADEADEKKTPAAPPQIPASDDQSAPSASETTQNNQS